jgi:putative DNA primase/helicase
MDDSEIEALVEKAKKKEPKPRKVVAPDGFGLIRGRDGDPIACQHNAEILLAQNWEPARTVRFDTFKDQHVIGDSPLFEKHYLEATKYLQRSHNTKFSKSISQDALKSLGYRREFDSLKDHVTACKWDGEPRLHTMASKYLGAEPTELNHAIIKCFVMSMAARALLPASYVRLVPILEGAQDLGKSRFFGIMGGPFFATLQAQMGTQAAHEQVIGAWVLEIPELAGMSKSEITSIKAFITQNTDRFRGAYKENVVAHARRSVLGGTTNQDQYLRDETGDTRFGPMKIAFLDMDALAKDRELLIGEAAHRVLAGESWLLPDDLKGAAAEATLERFERDPWMDKLEGYLATRGAKETTVVECLSSILGVEAERQDQRAANRVSRALRALGWVQRQRTTAQGIRQRFYVKPILT